MLGPRELLADHAWQGELKGAPGSRRLVHTPDLVGIVPGRRPAAIEVELTRKSKARLRAILGLHSRWIASGKSGACVYVCGNEDVRKLVVAQAEHIGLRAADGSLRVEMLENVKDLVRARGESRSTWNTSGKGPEMSRVELLVDVCAILTLGALGVLCAWTIRRSSTLSARNFYAPGAIGCSRARCCACGPRVDDRDGAGASGRVLRLRRALRQAAAAGGPRRRRGASLL